MLNKKSVFISLLILFVTLGVGFYVYQKGEQSKIPFTLKDKTFNCLRLYTGTVSVEVKYPDEFINVSQGGDVRIKRRGALVVSKPADEEYILGIDSRYYETLESIIDNSLVEPGPKYEKSTLNGYEAAYYRLITDEGDIMDQYSIPFGNRSFYLFYQPSFLTSEQQLAAEDMLHSITFIHVDEDIKGARVESCSH
ncbi:MAG: hypothetical protein WC659_03730 [Patescibacteria group bacterium]